MKHYSIVFSLLNILTLFVSCVRAGRFSTDLDQEFQKAADQERALSAQCLESRRLYGNLKYGMDQQNSSIITNNTVGHLIKRIDSETHGSPVRLRTLLLRELRENGRLSFPSRTEPILSRIRHERIYIRSKPERERAVQFIFVLINADPRLRITESRVFVLEFRVRRRRTRGQSVPSPPSHLPEGCLDHPRGSPISHPSPLPTSRT